MIENILFKNGPNNFFLVTLNTLLKKTKLDRIKLKTCLFKQNLYKKPCKSILYFLIYSGFFSSY